MSKSEEKFKKVLQDKYPGAYIRKIPDYKQLANPLMRGLPDYLVIYRGMTYWYEVKYMASKKTFNFNSFTPAQMVEFRRMYKNGGVDVQVAILNKDYVLYIVPFSQVIDLQNQNVNKMVFPL